MTTHDHPSDEAKPLEGEFASETDQPDENARPLDIDRTEDEDADQPSEAPTPHSASFRDRFSLSTRAWRVIGVIGLVLSVCGVGLAWAVASPLGASPDDDYHLGSIWCPPPLADSGCTTGYTERGTFGPVVPESIAATRVACYAFHGNESAVCALNNSDERTMVTDRWDDGNYPWGYYQFHHHFIGHNAAARA